MQFPHHKLIGAAAKIPISKPVPVVSYSPLVLPSPKRPVDLQLRVVAPATGDNLPIILLSHGQGRSYWLNSISGYAPVTDFWAAHGFVVLQPTHLSARFLSLEYPEGKEFYWQSRAEDIVQVLDDLDTIEASVPSIKGRLDKSKIAVAGHSLGGWTSSLLLGAKNTDPRDGATFSPGDKRIKAGVVLTGTGSGGNDLSDFGRKMVPFYGPDFSGMSTPALVVCGDEDVSPHLTTRGADWHADAYKLAPGPKDLLWVKGGKHGLGGISGYDAGETEDESPERLATVQRMTWAYLKSQLYEGDKSWEEACEAIKGLEELGSVEKKGQ